MELRFQARNGERPPLFVLLFSRRQIHLLFLTRFLAGRLFWCGDERELRLSAAAFRMLVRFVAARSWHTFDSPWVLVSEFRTITALEHSKVSGGVLKKRILGEEMLAKPECGLREIAWIGLRKGSEAIEEIKHPERSMLVSAARRRYGNDHFF
jgi:hypothetical protein